MDIEEQIEQIRLFNRAWGRRMGLYRGRLMGTDYSLTEARVLGELGRDGRVDLVELRRRLDIDAGYISRILSRFAAQGLLRTEPSPTDARRKVLSLTESGQQTFESVTRLINQGVRDVLDPLSDQEREILVESVQSARELLDDVGAPSPISLRGLGPGDLGWIVYRHGEVYADEYTWNRAYEASVAELVAGYVDRRDGAGEGAWIAEVGGVRAGSLFCLRHDEERARIDALFVEPVFRGRGIVQALLDEAIRFVRGVGYRELSLVTTDWWSRGEEVATAAGFVPVSGSSAAPSSLPPGAPYRAWLLDLTK